MPTGAKRPRNANGHRRREVKRWLEQQRRPCHICGLPIDYSLPPGHPLAFECDEVLPVSLGGSPIDRNNVDAAHRCCNQWRGNRMAWFAADAPTHHGLKFLPHRNPKARRGQAGPGDWRSAPTAKPQPKPTLVERIGAALSDMRRSRRW